MAKRLSPEALAKVIPNPDHPEVCGVCGGNVVLEKIARPTGYPRRYVCLNCESEWGTTRPAQRNY